MSHWNHRVVKEKDGTGEYYYSIREVYYKDGAIDGWSMDSRLIGNDYDDLKKGYELIRSAFEKPVLVVKGDELVEVEGV